MMMTLMIMSMITHENESTYATQPWPFCVLTFANKEVVENSWVNVARLTIYTKRKS